MKCRLPLLATLFFVVFAATGATQEKGGIDLNGPYDAVPGWLKTVAEGWILHPTTIFAESPDRIFIGSLGVTEKATAPPTLTIYNPRLPGARKNHHMVVVNRNGEVVERWTQWYQKFGSPHRVTINPYDPQKHIWVVDRDSQQVMQFTHDGKQLLMAIGEEGVAGADDRHFNQPTELAFLPDGTFFVSDGDNGTRIVKFDRNGKFLLTFGTKGTGPGQFGSVHGLAVDARHRVYAVDRGKDRINIFDENGTFIEEWPGFVSPARILITNDQFAWVLDAGAHRVAKYDLNGKLLTYFGTPGTFPGAMATPHDFTVDPEGNLYVSNGYNHTVDKYVPKPNADRTRVVGYPLGLTGTR